MQALGCIQPREHGVTGRFDLCPLLLPCWGSMGSITAAAAGNIPFPPLLITNVGKTCCAMTLISKENCKAFFFSLSPPAEFSTECELGGVRAWLRARFPC